MFRTLLMTLAFFTAGLKAAYAAPDALFDQNTPLVEGQEVNETGVVEYYTHANDPNVVSAYARLKVNNGEFNILMDTVGKDMATTKDHSWVVVRGLLTGKVYVRRTSTPSEHSAGTALKGPRVPEIKIEEFR